MQKLSLLIFTRNEPPEKVIAALKDLSGIVDQIVLVDSSAKDMHNLLEKKISASSLKVDLYHTLALGYADPMRAYGLLKCKHNWVLYIDTDERINDALKKDIKNLITKENCDGFAIERHEYAHIDGRKGKLSTWQIRLYDKRKTEYRGMIHEQPIVNGRLKRLDRKYYMLHIEELKLVKSDTKNSSKREYSDIRRYDRLSYELLNRRIIEYLGKAIFVEDGKIESTSTAKLVMGILKLYQKIKMKKNDEEISIFDYSVYHWLVEMGYTLKSGDMVNYFNKDAKKTVRGYMESIKSARMDPESDRIFEISKIINKVGIIKYLKLDDEKVVKKLYKKYSDRKQGIELLIRLLEQRYSGTYP